MVSTVAWLLIYLSGNAGIRACKIRLVEQLPMPSPEECLRAEQFRLHIKTYLTRSTLFMIRSVRDITTADHSCEVLSPKLILCYGYVKAWFLCVMKWRRKSCWTAVIDSLFFTKMSKKNTRCFIWLHLVSPERAQILNQCGPNGTSLTYVSSFRAE